MKILINTLVLSKGGGQKVALNIISHLITKPYPHTFYFICQESSVIHSFLIKNRVDQILAVKTRNPFERIYWEIFRSKECIDRIAPDIIYSIFGYSFFPRKYKQVIGVAVSNIFFPEIDFWKDYSLGIRLKKRIIDCYRKNVIKWADGLIFENPLMLERAQTLHHISKNKVCYIKPSIKDLTENIESIFFSSLVEQKSDFNMLLLCGWQKNKNYMIMPYVVKRLKEMGNNITIFFSVAEDEKKKEYISFKRIMELTGTRENFVLIGTIAPEFISCMYKVVDAVLLLSRLESFSNNIIESWAYNKVLVVSDALWARAIIKDAACFVDRDNVDDIADKINLLIHDNEYYNLFVEEGKKEIESYPKINEHIENILSFLIRVV